MGRAGLSVLGSYESFGGADIRRIKGPNKAKGNIIERKGRHGVLAHMAFQYTMSQRI